MQMSPRKVQRGAKPLCILAVSYSSYRAHFDEAQLLRLEIYKPPIRGLSSFSSRKRC